MRYSDQQQREMDQRTGQELDKRSRKIAMTELLMPCPFCGGSAERIDIDEPGDNFGGSCICCTGCGASSPVHFDRKENLYSSWNDRMDDQELVIQREAITQALWHWGEDKDRGAILASGGGWKTDTFGAVALLRAAFLRKDRGNG